MSRDQNDLEISMQSSAFQIEQVLGSPEANQSRGELLCVNTLFPTPTDRRGRAKGGIVLLKLKKIADIQEDIKLMVSYQDRKGTIFPNETSAEFPPNFLEEQQNLYPHDGIRKAVLLARYYALLKKWTGNQRAESAGKKVTFGDIRKVN